LLEHYARMAGLPPSEALTRLIEKEIGRKPVERSHAAPGSVAAIIKARPHGKVA
jgi:hypothetical protein